MNKLKGSLFYLCGPIDYAKDLGIGWRQVITPKIRAFGAYVLDPTNKPVLYQELYEDAENHQYRAKLKAEGRFEEIHKSGRPVRAFDLRCCDKSDCIIAYLDVSIPMTGTLEEIFTSNKDKKPVLIFCKQGKKAVSDWLYWTLPPRYIFENMDGVLEYLDKVNRGLEDDNKRWHFFDWDKIVRGE